MFESASRNAGHDTQHQFNQVINMYLSIKFRVKMTSASGNSGQVKSVTRCFLAMIYKTYFRYSLCFFAILLFFFHSADAQRRDAAIPRQADANHMADTIQINHNFELAMSSLDSGYTAGRKKAIYALAFRLLTASTRLKFRSGELKSFLLLANIDQSPEDRKKRIAAEKALTIAKQQGRGISQADAEIAIADSYAHSSAGLKLAEIHCTRAVSILKKEADNTAKYANALRLSGWLHASLAQPDVAIKELSLAVSIAKANKVIQLQRYYAAFVEAYQHLRDFNGVFKYSLMALRLAERYGDTETCFDQYTILAYYYGRSSNLAKQSYYLEKARLLSNFRKNSNGAVYVAVKLGSAYNQMQQYQKAIKVMKEGLLKGAIEKDEYYVDLYAVLIDSYLATKQIAEAEKLYPELAEKWNASIFNYSNFAHSEFHSTIAQIAMGRLSVYTHQLSRAQGHFAMASRLVNARWRDVDIMVSYEHLGYQLDSAGGNFRDAMDHYKLYKHYNDSAVNEGHAAEVSQLQVQYETQKKDEDIALKARNISLLERQTTLQQNAIRSDAMVKNLSFIAVALLTLLLGISYNRYRIKQRSLLETSIANQELAARQEEINTQNESLKELLIEREWLVKEIHHRVKNNLQIVISLLNSQLANIKDVSAKNVLRESQHRMHSISLIHQKLYQDDNLTVINMSEYVRELVSNLQDSFGTDGRINFTIRTGDVTLDVAQAVPMGLILNEAITNSIKYAFDNKEDSGNILIDMQYQGSKLLFTSIIDDGKGLPEGLDPLLTKSLGLNLIRGLAGQLKGTAEFINDRGLHILISIPVVKIY